MGNWHDFTKEVPPKAGEYVVAFYPASFDCINNERMHVGIDVFSWWETDIKRQLG